MSLKSYRSYGSQGTLPGSISDEEMEYIEHRRKCKKRTGKTCPRSHRLDKDCTCVAYEVFTGIGTEDKFEDFNDDKGWKKIVKTVNIPTSGYGRKFVTHTFSKKVDLQAALDYANDFLRKPITYAYYKKYGKEERMKYSELSVRGDLLGNKTLLDFHIYDNSRSSSGSGSRSRTQHSPDYDDIADSGYWYINTYS